MPDPAPYCSIDDARGAGVPDTLDDAAVTAKIMLAMRYIDLVTGLWFNKRTLTLQLDGNDKPSLPLPAPLLAVTSLTMSGQVVAPTSYVNRNQRELEDFYDPRLEWVALPLRYERAFGIGPYGSGAAYMQVWAWGQRNIEIAGDWGFVEPDDSTPALLGRGCALLAANLSRAGDDRFNTYLQSERFGNYAYDYGASARSQGVLLTGDVEIDGIIATFTRVPAMALA